MDWFSSDVTIRTPQSLRIFLPTVSAVASL
nr:MAG TPA: hypothetical protein [Caudoviricetes sp.]